jgi:thioredoxin-like negative regulator of GroEL
MRTEMPDFDDIEDAENLEEQPERGSRKFVRDLENKVDSERELRKAAEAKAAAGEQAQRELAFVKAGIDTDKGGGKLLFKSYDGEMTADAIRKAAEEYDIIPTSQQESVKEELAGLQGIEQAGSNASAPTPPDLISQIRGAKSPQEAIELARKAGSVISTEEPGEFFDPR